MKTRTQGELAADLIEARNQVTYVVSCNEADLREARSLLAVKGYGSENGLNEILQALQAWKDASNAFAESFSSEED